MRQIISHLVLSFIPLAFLGSGFVPTVGSAGAPTTKPSTQPDESTAARGFGRALRDANVNAVTKALDSGISANDRIYGDMPLAIAAMKGNLKIATLLLDHGAKPDSDNQWGCTALYCAAWHADAPMVQLLLEHGAKSQIESSLAYAAFHGETNVLRALIDHGANVNSPDTANRKTPLYKAASKGHKEAVLMLLEAGADPAIANDDGITPAVAAKEYNHPEIADVISSFKPKADKSK